VIGLQPEAARFAGIRVARIKGPRAYSLQPAVSGQHLLQAPEVEQADQAANEYRLRTPFVYAEARGPERTVLYGTVRHALRREPGGLRIVLKRVDLLGAGAPLPSIHLFV